MKKQFMEMTVHSKALEVNINDTENVVSTLFQDLNNKESQYQMCRGLGPYTSINI